MSFAFYLVPEESGESGWMAADLSPDVAM
jgi:hypothetical protein